MGLPLCKWCRRPIRGDLDRHQRRCYWCETCEDFVTTDVGKHKCSPLGPHHFPCPVCGRITETSNYMRHLRKAHDDVDPELYRRRTESASARDHRLKREGKVIVRLRRLNLFLRCKKHYFFEIVRLRRLNLRCFFSQGVWRRPIETS